MKDMRVRLSTLWVFALFNRLYADIVTLTDPATLNELIAGRMGGTEVTPGFLLVAAVLMETAIAMVVLSRVLSYRANRWCNVAVGALHTVVVGASLFVGGKIPPSYYMFFATVGIACTMLIVGYAWRWKPAAESS